MNNIDRLLIIVTMICGAFIVYKYQDLIFQSNFFKKIEIRPKSKPHRKKYPKKITVDNISQISLSSSENKTKKLPTSKAHRALDTDNSDVSGLLDAMSFED